MNIQRKRLQGIRADWSNEVSFALFERRGDKIAHSTAIEMYLPKDEEMGMRIEPTFTLNPSEVQELMDNLWQLGFRPSEGTGSAGALAATQKHLDDMRKIAFDFLERK